MGFLASLRHQGYIGAFRGFWVYGGFWRGRASGSENEICSLSGKFKQHGFCENKRILSHRHRSSHRAPGLLSDFSATRRPVTRTVTLDASRPGRSPRRLALHTQGPVQVPVGVLCLVVTGVFGEQRRFSASTLEFSSRSLLSCFSSSVRRPTNRCQNRN